MDWYYISGDQQQHGPLAESDLGGLVQAGTITPQTMMWKEGMTDWQPASNSLPQLFSGAVASAAVATAAPLDKDLSVQAMREGLTGNLEVGALNYAGFWIRFAAKFIDGILLNIVTFIVQMLIGLTIAGAQDNDAVLAFAGILIITLSLAIPLCYNGYMIGKYGATLGKMACGLKVVLPDGSPVSMGRGFGRYLGEILSGLILGIGYLMAAFDDEKRALHDRVVSTRVIKSR